MTKSHNQTIFALSTTYGSSAVAIFRISGPKSSEIAKKYCRIKKLRDRFVHYTNIYDHKKQIIDRGCIIFFKSPRSYTGEDLLELHVHGSIAIIRKISDFLSKLPDLRLANPGEFSKRALLNNKGNALYFEGINNLIYSETENQRLAANKQIFGNSSNKLSMWRQKLLNTMAFIDAEIEFSEEVEKNNKNLISDDIESVKSEISRAVENYDTTNSLMHGTNVMIVGPTNVGKSSLFNFLIQDEKMIVSNIEGTTTDQSEKSIDIFGNKANLIDSAGIRMAKNSIESKGIKKTFETINKTQKFILVLSPDSFNKENIKSMRKILIKLGPKNTVVIFNKADLLKSKVKFNEWVNEVSELKKLKSISISCVKKSKTNNMLIKIYNFINKNLLSVDTNEKDYYFSELRHHRCLMSIHENLGKAQADISNLEICNKYLRDAVDDLDELFGKHNTEDQLETIFNNFCIGK
tara:strand:+ start:1008 stop:2399 length:1392 start_codon:yes stop_codon:yes gene_type:complete